ncbi:glycosyltransferase family protein [Arcticibacter eurypsychrophilus]|uniref:glycosyl transferase n=1 Tax=Arcticibacter eurypsychrophilus TaxID=1434752 RepID=UPI00084D1CA1|nr:glycosyl transferase [Arcticibacter eurypsychrophilus]
MKVTGFSFIRNAAKNDYPIVEAIKSILPLCDEFVVAHGNSEDETLRLIKNIGSDKIRIIQTTWDDDIREGGKVFADETDKAYEAISADTDWAFYIQGDECVHEKYHPIIRREMEDNVDQEEVEGLLFNYLHFYGSYDYIATTRRWYRKEIRLLKFRPGVRSYRDAQGFRKNGKKLQVKLIDAYIYHYGWVKPPAGLKHKMRNFNQYYQTQEWVEQNIPSDYVFDYGNAHILQKFEGSHPAVIQPRINASNWKFSFDPVKLQKNTTLRYRILHLVERLTGWRVGEYKNYKIIS